MLAFRLYMLMRQTHAPHILRSPNSNGAYSVQHQTYTHTTENHTQFKAISWRNVLAIGFAWKVKFGIITKKKKVPKKKKKTTAFERREKKTCTYIYFIMYSWILSIDKGKKYFLNFFFFLPLSPTLTLSPYMALVSYFVHVRFVGIRAQDSKEREKNSCIKVYFLCTSSEIRWWGQILMYKKRTILDVYSLFWPFFYAHTHISLPMRVPMVIHLIRFSSYPHVALPPICWPSSQRAQGKQ